MRYNLTLVRICKGGVCALLRACVLAAVASAVQMRKRVTRCQMQNCPSCPRKREFTGCKYYAEISRQDASMCDSCSKGCVVLVVLMSASAVAQACADCHKRHRRTRAKAELRDVRWNKFLYGIIITICRRVL